ncbi:hypothetical protein [Streptomyces sp. NPDC088350]|uniref:hypothetical protein n=1 Tax=Streptomyces sp. NPDC088350 TaxID=3365854 RepID=UPI003816EF45
MEAGPALTVVPAPRTERPLAPGRRFKEALPETPVVFTVHELKRLAGNAADLVTLSIEFAVAFKDTGVGPAAPDRSTAPFRGAICSRPSGPSG